MQSSAKVRTGQLWSKNKDELSEQLKEAKSELLALRTQKIAGGAASKLTRMYVDPWPRSVEFGTRVGTGDLLAREDEKRAFANGPPTVTTSARTSPASSQSSTPTRDTNSASTTRARSTYLWTFAQSRLVLFAAD